EIAANLVDETDKLRATPAIAPEGEV
ncbi:MAG: hypothetical protein QOH37_1004, partial [Nocardioidaceae bacterium]|nr:hypothetical protein [Nocardioidaceae bacterium]